MRGRRSHYTMPGVWDKKCARASIGGTLTRYEGTREAHSTAHLSEDSAIKDQRVKSRFLRGSRILERWRYKRPALRCRIGIPSSAFVLR